MNMIAAPATVTPEEFLEMGDAAAGFELVDGQLRENPMSTESARVGGRVFLRVGNQVEQHRLGWTFPQETCFRCFTDDPGRVRKPDGAFITFETLPKAEYVRNGFCTAVPDIVWEVLSPNDIARDVDLKIDEWLVAGVEVVWVVQPENNSVRVYKAEGPIAHLREKGTLTEPGQLPGFALPVADIFKVP